MACLLCTVLLTVVEGDCEYGPELLLCTCGKERLKKSCLLGYC